ncbi:hypothetical protein ABPG72_020719 [Tetrahymena utriculariae]
MSNKRKVQFIEPQISKEIIDANEQQNIFSNYNSEHLLQFKSPRPSQSFSDHNHKIEPKLHYSIDDDIELDDNGQSLAERKEMMQKFQQFDVFLVKNREKIEYNKQSFNQPIQNIPSMGEGDFKSNRGNNSQQQSQQNIPAFSGLKDLRIDFNKVISNIPPDQLQDILYNNQAQPTNDQNSNLNSARFLMLHGINPSSDSINNGENFSFFQGKKSSRRQNKAITLAQTSNIQCFTTFGPLTKLENKKNGFKHVQDIILRLSIKSSLMIYKFIRIMKKKIRFNGLHELTQQQLMLINDLSYFYLDNSKSKGLRSTTISKILKNKIVWVFSASKKYVQHQLESCLSCIVESKPIDPTSNWMMFWLILQFMFIVVALFYTPLELINGDEYDKKYGKPWIVFKAVNWLAFFLDIIVKFNTGLFEKGQIVMNRREIVKSYFKGNFLYDVLALIPITQTLLNIGYLRPMNLLILLKVQTARRILNQIQEMVSQKNNKTQNALSLLQLLLMICSVCHIFACLFQGIAVLEQNYDITKTNWMQKYGVDGDDVHWFIKYNCSLYFAVTTMITVGYGDIVPITLYEIFFVTIAMFVSCGVFAYSFNQIGDLVREQNRLSNEFKNEMVLVNRLLEKKKINRDLMIQVRKFLEYRFYAEPQLSMEEERMVMGKLSSHLREKVILESNLQIINQCSILKNNFSNVFLQTLALKMTEMRVSKNEIIFEQEDFDEDPFLYIVDKGDIEIFVETDKTDQEVTILQVIHQGSYFGEINFFREGLREASARAQDFAILYGIPKSQFLQIIQDYPIDFEQYCFMRDSFVFDNKLKIIDQKCYVCGKEDHLQNRCNLVHYVPDQEKVILRENFSTKQLRVVRVRHRGEKFNSLKNINIVIEQQDVYFSSEQNQQFVQINYQFLLDELSLTEENVNMSLTQNTSNLGGQIQTNPNLNGYNNNNNNNNNMFNFREKQATILPNIQKHVSNIFTSGGSALGDYNHRNDISRNDASDNESPRSNDRGQFTYIQQQTPNIFSTQNTNSNVYNNLQNTKIPTNRFGQAIAYQTSNSNNLMSVNALGLQGLKKKPALKKYTTHGIEEEDNNNNNNTSFQGQTPTSNVMLQQIMQMLQRMVIPQNQNLQGYSNMHSFTSVSPMGVGGTNLNIMRLKAGGFGANSKQHTYESEDTGYFYGSNNSKNRGAHRNLSYLNKKKEKELLIQQLQLNNQFNSVGMQNIDISPFFEKSKIYTVYYPQYNLNTVLKMIENVSLKQQKQPDYFGIYSFFIGPQFKKKQSIQKEEQSVYPQNGGLMKNSQVVTNLNQIGYNNGMQNSVMIINNNYNQGNLSKYQSLYTFNQSFGQRHKGSMNNFKESLRPKDKDTDSQKQKKNSLRAYNSLFHLKSSTIRQESLYGNIPVTEKQEKIPIKSTFGQINNNECNSIYQEKEKSHYPKFIFKKLITLS